METYFQPVSKHAAAHAEILAPHTLGKKVIQHTVQNGFPDLSHVKIAFFVVAENRNACNYKGVAPDFEATRMAFYTLYPGHWSHTIADLGNLKLGATVADTYAAVQTVVQELIEQHIIPIILGGSQDIIYGQYRACQRTHQYLNIVNIDACFDLGDPEAPISDRSYMSKIISEKPYGLAQYTVLGYQTYLNAPEEIAFMEKMHFDLLRLGSLSKHIEDAEVFLRTAHLVAIDTAAIAQPVSAYKNTVNPNGLDGKEICALARYAGISNTVQSFGIFSMEQSTNPKQTHLLWAQILWYFIEGVNLRIQEGDFSNPKAFMTYKVLLADNDTITFKKSLKSNRWWMEVPFTPTSNNNLNSATLLPCTYQDYQEACQQEIPERWYRARRKNEL